LNSVNSWIKANENLFFPFLAFAIPFMIRFIPEIFMGPFVVGFDTIGSYVPTTLAWLNGGVDFWSFIASAPFLYVILMGSTSIGIPIVITLKVMSPLLLGFLGLVVYFYANQTLSWSTKKSLLVVLFATLYFVALRVSWDLLRCEFALIFLFAALIFLKAGKNALKSGVLLSLAMISAVFAHPLVAVIMFVIVLVTLIRFRLDRQVDNVRRLLVCSVPAGVLLLFMVYANYVVFPQFSMVSGFLGESSKGFTTLFGFDSRADLLIDAFSFPIFCYLPLLPLAVLGVKRSGSNLQLNAWILCILIALSLAIANIFVAVLPYRWTLLLTYPLAFYAAEGFFRLKLNVYKIGVGLILATLSVSFLVLPNEMAFCYYSAYPLYVPKSMLQNTIPLRDCQDTVNVLQWAKTNMDNNTRLLVHEAFYGWACLALDNDQLIPYGYDSPETMAQKLTEDGFSSQLYLIWWVNGSGWYAQPTIYSAFSQPLYESGRIAIFRYNASTYLSNSDSACNINTNIIHSFEKPTDMT
jgi:hypothetical protein